MSTSVIKSYLLLAGVLFLIFGLALVGCLQSQLEGRAFLEILRPVVDQLLSGFAYPRNYHRDFYRWVFGLVATLVTLVGAFSLCFRRMVGLWVAVVCLVALTPEYLVLQGYPVATCLLWWAVCIFIVFIITGRLPVQNSDCSSSYQVSRVSMAEAWAFFAISLMFIVARFYLLNRVPNSWDTESCPFRYTFWHSFAGVMNHEAGQSPQTSAGFSWNLLYWLMGHEDEPDNYYLYVRLLSQTVGTVKYLALFLFVRSVFGIFPAFAAIALLGFGPPEDWWSREPTLHHLPGLLAIAVLWTSVRAYRKRRWGDFVLTSVLIGLTRLVYPSGMFFGFVAPTFFSLLVVCKWKEWRVHIPKVLTLLLGIAFWLSWRSIARALVSGHWVWLAPLEVPSHSTLPVDLGEKLNVIFVRNGWDVVKGLLLEQSHPTHWTFALTLAPPRSTTSFVLVMLVASIGRCLRGRSGDLGLLLFMALGWSVFPAMVTEVADRRMGVAFTVLIIIAVREAGYLSSLLSESVNRYLARSLQFSLVAVLCLYLGWISANVRFRMGEGTPHQLIRGKLLREALEDDALMVYLTGELGCDIFFSVYQDLQARECKTGWTVVDYDGAPELKEQMSHPRVRSEHWAYRETRLHQCLQAHLNKDWRRYIFLLSEASRTQKTIEELRVLYPQGQLEEKVYTDGDARSIKVWIYRVNIV